MDTQLHMPFGPKNALSQDMGPTHIRFITVIYKLVCLKSFHDHNSSSVIHVDQCMVIDRDQDIPIVCRSTELKDTMH